MRAVVMVVVAARRAAFLERTTPAAVHPTGYIQVWMLEIHSRVDYRHVHIHAVIIAGVDIEIRIGVPKYALDAGGYSLCVNGAQHVFYHVYHAWVFFQGCQPACGNSGGHPSKCILVGETHLQAVSLFQGRHGRVHIYRFAL